MWRFTVHSLFVIPGLAKAQLKPYGYRLQCYMDQVNIKSRLHVCSTAVAKTTVLP